MLQGSPRKHPQAFNLTKSDPFEMLRTAPTGTHSEKRWGHRLAPESPWAKHSSQLLSSFTLIEFIQAECNSLLCNHTCRRPNQTPTAEALLTHAFRYMLDARNRNQKAEQPCTLRLDYIDYMFRWSESKLHTMLSNFRGHSAKNARGLDQHTSTLTAAAGMLQVCWTFNCNYDCSDCEEEPGLENGHKMQHVCLSAKYSSHYGVAST